MLTRLRKKLAPGRMDPVFLCQDIDRLDAAIESPHFRRDPLLAQSAEIETEARRLRVPDLIAKSLLQRSRIHFRQKGYSDAIAALAEADRALGDLRQYDLKVYILAGLAQAHARLHNWPEVLKVCGEGIERVEAHRQNVSGQYLQSSYLSARIGLYANGTRAAFETKDYETMLRFAELSKCRSVLRAPQRSTIPTGEERELQSQFRAVSSKIDELRAAADASKEEIEELCRKRRVVWDSLLIERGPRNVQMLRFDLAQLQGLLANDEAVLYYYWVERDELLAVAIDHATLHAEIISVDRDRLDAFSAGIFSSANCDSTAFQAHLDESAEFTESLLPPQIKEILNGKARLVISPHRVLHALPFQALPWDHGRHALVEHFSITYAPNLSCLLAQYVPSPRRNLLALGVDKFNVCLDKVPDLVLADGKVSDLVGAEAEGHDLETLYRSKGHTATSWSGPDANEAALHNLEERGALRDFTTLHFATHGFNVNSDTPMESFIVLYDSLLDGLEIANWQLSAELVVLSACSSGQRAIAGRGLDELPGDDLFGLQAAFFAAGAKWVLGSLWPVRSDVSRAIMTAFHEFLLDGHSPDAALQRATLKHIDHAGPRTRQSRYWAPFFLSTVGRPVSSTQT